MQFDFVCIGSDHGGFNLKKIIMNYLNNNKIEFKDFGTFSKESVDYVDYAFLVAREVAKNKKNCGILCCSSGIGVSIVANKVPGVRAALCVSNFHAEFARKHNNANIICFGQKVSNSEQVLDMINIFLNTGFDGGRHESRVNKILNLEKNKGEYINERS